MIELLEQYASHSAYLFVTVYLLMSGFGLPLPEDIPLILAGFLCRPDQNVASLWIMLPLCFSCILGSDLILYLLGRRWGHHVTRFPILRRFLTPARLARAERTFHQHGGKALFAARFLPGVRSPMFFTAGVFKIPAWKFLAFDGAAALLSVPTLILCGYFFPYESVKKWSREGQILLVVVVCLCILGFIVWRNLRRKRQEQAAADGSAPS